MKVSRVISFFLILLSMLFFVHAQAEYNEVFNSIISETPTPIEEPIDPTENFCDIVSFDWDRLSAFTQEEVLLKIISAGTSCKESDLLIQIIEEDFTGSSGPIITIPITLESSTGTIPILLSEETFGPYLGDFWEFGSGEFRAIIKKESPDGIAELTQEARSSILTVETGSFDLPEKNGDDSGTPLTSDQFDTTDTLAPIGTTKTGETTISFTGSSYLFTYTESGSVLASYEIDITDPLIQKGVLSVKETITGSYPLFHAGTIYRNSSYNLLDPLSFIAIQPAPTITFSHSIVGDNLVRLEYNESIVEGGDTYTTAKIYDFEIVGKTLIWHANSQHTQQTATNNYAGITFGRSANTQQPRHLSVPYMEHAPTLIANNGTDTFYSSTYYDWSLSNSNEYSSGTIGPASFPDSYHYAYEPTYTLGEREIFTTLNETSYITVSATIDDTWMNINRPASPYLADLKNRTFLDIGATYFFIYLSELTAFERAAYIVGLMNRYGMKDLLVELWGWSELGDAPCYNLGPPHSIVNVGHGGLSGIKHIVDKAASYGYLTSGYQEYVGMYNNTKDNKIHGGWNESKLARNYDGGHMNYGWSASNCAPHRDRIGNLVPQPLTIKPAEWTSYYENDSTYLRNNVNFTASFLDVHSKLPISTLIDYSYDDNRSRTAAQIFNHTKTLFEFQHQTFKGPLITEGGPGSTQASDLSFAGYLDGSYGEIQGNEYAMIIPDYELKYTKDKAIRYGMGFHERWDTTDFNITTFDWDKYQATQIAYGHAAYMGDWFLLQTPEWNIWDPTPAERLAQERIYKSFIKYWVKEYYLFKELQKQYLNSNVVLIEYRNATNSFLSLEEAIEQNYDFNNSQLRIGYDNGLILFINRHQTERWDADTPIGTYHLPANGWFAYNIDNSILAYSALVDANNKPSPTGTRADFVLTRDYLLADGRGSTIHFGEVFNHDVNTDLLVIVKPKDWRLVELRKGGFELFGDSSFDPVITALKPQTIDSRTGATVSITGTNFESFYGILFNGSFFRYNLNGKRNPYLEYVNSGMVRLGVPPGLLDGNYSVRVLTSQGDLFSNEKNLTVAKSSIGPVIVQTTPIPHSQDSKGIITLYGERFTNDMEVLLNGIPYKGPQLLYDERKYALLVGEPAKALVTTIQLRNKNGDYSNLFYFNETNRRFPELVTISSPIFADETNKLIFKGHNFNERYSQLYLDNSLLPPSDFELTINQNRTFQVIIDTTELSHGEHRLHFTNPTITPEVQHKNNAPFDPLKSNVLFFLKKTLLKPDITLSNNEVNLTFNGDLGSLQQISDKNGKTYKVRNVFPWRVQLRTLDSGGSLRYYDNLYQHRDYFNPVAGTCNFSHTIVATPAGQELTLAWENCTIDNKNTFDFKQVYTLNNTSPYVEFYYEIYNADVNGYGVYAVRNYLTLEDDPAVKEFGLVSNRLTETYQEPGHTIASRGGRDTCTTWSTGSAVEVGCTDSFETTPEYWLQNDGDGYKLYNFLDIWGALWDEKGNYLYYFPVDDHSYIKDFSYQGQFGHFKNGLITYHPNSFFAKDFEYRLPYNVRIGIGTGTEFTGKETWVNIADIYRDHLKSMGRLKTPFVKRDIPDFLKGIDLHMLTSHRDELFDEDNKPLPNPPIKKIVEAYNTSNNYFEAENTFYFIWGGDQEPGKGVQFDPTPETAQLFESLNDIGVHPCYYTVAGGTAIVKEDPLFEKIKSDTVHIDPAGSEYIETTPEANSTIMHPSSHSLTEPSYLQYLLDKFKVMHESNIPGKKRARCFYLDGIGGYIYPEGVWSDKFKTKGFDREVANFTYFLSKLSKEIRKIDDEAFVFHEAFLDTSTFEGVIPMQGTPAFGPYNEPWVGISPEDIQQDIYFSQRIFLGYTDFFTGNIMVTPNNPPPAFHIEPKHYPLLKKAPFNMSPTYDRSLLETYSMPFILGALHGGGATFIFEPGMKVVANFTPLHLSRQNTNPALSDEWKATLSDTSPIIKELVRARKVARPYFHGLWHLPLPTNLPEEDYYYLTNSKRFLSPYPEVQKTGLTKVAYPNTINIVRQPWNHTADNWSKNYGLLFMNMRGDQQNYNVTFTLNYSRYGINQGSTYGLFLNSSKGLRYLKKVNGDFTHTITIPARTFTLLELKSFEGLPDSDKDTVPDSLDRCPKTTSTFKDRVNRWGCPRPLSSKFNRLLTTDFDNVDNLSAVKDLKLGIRRLGKSVGQISLAGETVSLLRESQTSRSKEPLDLDRYIQMSHRSIFLDAKKLPELNVTSELTFFNTGITNPVIYRNGNYDPKAKVKRYNAVKKDVIVRVKGFSNYTVEQGTCGDKICSITETKNSCSTDCGSPGGSGGGSGGGGGGGNKNTKQTLRINLNDFKAHTIRATTNHQLFIQINTSEYLILPTKISNETVTLQFTNTSETIAATNDQKYYVNIDKQGTEDLWFTIPEITTKDFLLNISRVQDPSIIDRGGNRTGGDGNKTGKKIGGEEGKPSAWILLLLAIPMLTAIIFLIAYTILSRKKIRSIENISVNSA